MPETLDTVRGCQKVLPDDGTEPRVRTRYYCEAPARRQCSETGQRYCDEHAHERDCCGIDESEAVS